MKCRKHGYGYEDLPLLNLQPPDNMCSECWAIYALNQGNGEIAPCNMDILEDVFTIINIRAKGASK